MAKSKYFITVYFTEQERATFELFHQDYVLTSKDIKMTQSNLIRQVLFDAIRKPKAIERVARSREQEKSRSLLKRTAKSK